MFLVTQVRRSVTRAETPAVTDVGAIGSYFVLRDREHLFRGCQDYCRFHGQSISFRGEVVVEEDFVLPEELGADVFEDDLLGIDGFRYG